MLPPPPQYINSVNTANNSQSQGAQPELTPEQIAEQKRNEELNALGLQNKKGAGTQLQDANGKIYTVIGEATSGRQIIEDEEGNLQILSSDNQFLDKEEVKRSNKADAIRSNPKIARESTVEMLDEQIQNAQAAFDKQMAEDGWAGDVADGISVLWGSENRASKVREDLKAYNEGLSNLKNAAAKGGDEFKAAFKEMFGTEYDENAVANYVKDPSDENYEKAFGTKNNIGQRVAKYNASQQTGAAAVKTGTTFLAGGAIVVATGGAGLGLVGMAAVGTVAAGTAASSLAINASDRMSSDVGLKEGELEEIAKNAAWDGASVVAGGVVGKVAATAVRGASKAAGVARAAINTTGDVAMGAAQEYAETGTVTAGGVATNAALGSVGIAAETGAFKKVKNMIGGNSSTPDVPAAGTASAPAPRSRGQTNSNINTDMNVSSFYEKLSEAGVRGEVFIKEDGSRLVRVKTSNNPINPKYDYYEFDANKNFVSMNEGMTKAEFQSTYSDFAGINPKKCGSSSGTLSSGGFGDLADSANSKANYNKLKTELTANQPKSILTDDNLDVINDMAKDPEAVKDVLDNITARIRAGEMPSKEMMDEISSEISGKYGIPGAPLASRTKRILEHMDDNWYQIKDFFNTPQKANLSSTSRLKRLDKFMENKNLLPEEQLNARAEQAKIKAQKEAELKAEQERQQALLKEQEEARLQAERAAERQKLQEQQEILDKYQDIYPEVVNANNFRDDADKVKLISLLDNYDLEMSPKDFDSRQIYQKISDAGISNDADMDIAFDMIKKRFHADTIAHEARVKELKTKYKPFSEDSIDNADNVIAQLKEKHLAGEKITEDEIENLIENLDRYDHRDFDRIKNMIYDDPELTPILNNDMHLDILRDPKFKNIDKPEINNAIDVYENLKNDFKDEADISMDTIFDYIHTALVKDKGHGGRGFISDTVLIELLSKDEVMREKCKDYLSYMTQ